MVKTV